MRNVFCVVLASICCLAFPATLVSLDLSRYVTKPEAMYQTPEYTIHGWSSAGAFAYSYTLLLEGIGGTRYGYCILDTVEDVVLFQETLDVTPENPEGDPDLSRERFFSAMDAAAIVQGRGTELYPFPLQYRGDTYSVKVITEPENDEEAFFDNIASYRVTVTSRRRGTKQITSGNDIRAVSMQPAGCFLSPFEARMLVVIMSETFIFEGTEGRFLFSGSHLTFGFH